MRATGFLALIFLLIASTLGAEANPPEETTVHVATDGDDRNPGTADRPLATLAAARDRVRTVKAGCGGPVTVVVRGGTYYLPETLSLTPEDSGSATAPRPATGCEPKRPVAAARSRSSCAAGPTICRKRSR